MLSRRCENRERLCGTSSLHELLRMIARLTAACPWRHRISHSAGGLSAICSAKAPHFAADSDCAGSLPVIAERRSVRGPRARARSQAAKRGLLAERLRRPCGRTLCQTTPSRAHGQGFFTISDANLRHKLWAYCTSSRRHGAHGHGAHDAGPDARLRPAGRPRAGLGRGQAQRSPGAAAQPARAS